MAPTFTFVHFVTFLWNLSLIWSWGPTEACNPKLEGMRIDGGGYVRQGYTRSTLPQCSFSNPEKRTDCGWPGITRAQCEAWGCCFDSVYSGAYNCFPTRSVARECSFSNPQQRTDCGWSGITMAQCEARGCCFDSTFKGNMFCFPKSNPYCTGNYQDSFSCGTRNTTAATCGRRGCCYDAGLRCVTGSTDTVPTAHLQRRLVGVQLQLSSWIPTSWLGFVPVTGTKTSFINLAQSVALGNQADLQAYLTTELQPQISPLTFNNLAASDPDFTIRMEFRNAEDHFYHEATKGAGFDKNKLDSILNQCGRRTVVKSVNNYALDTIKSMENSKQEQCTGSPVSSKQPEGKKRGDHVINNGVLSIYRDIVDKFCELRLRRQFGSLTELTSGLFTSGAQIWVDYHNPIPDRDIVNDIQNVIVAWFPQNSLRVDANSVTYGTYVHAIRSFAVTHMQKMYNDRSVQSTYESQSVGRLAHQMNVDLVYVDHLALNQWLVTGGDMRKYDRARVAVQRMLEALNGKLRQWVYDLNNYGYGIWPGFSHDELRK